MKNFIITFAFYLTILVSFAAVIPFLFIPKPNNIQQEIDTYQQEVKEYGLSFGQEIDINECFYMYVGSTRSEVYNAENDLLMYEGSVTHCTEYADELCELIKSK